MILMGWWMAGFYDRLMERTEAACLARWRRDLLRDVSGVAVEIGTGTGLNLPHYGNRVERLVLTEPDGAMRSRLEERLETLETAFPVEVRAAGADDLPFPDATFDAAISTLVLCSVPRPREAIREIHRVLRPGGRLFFLEHVAAEERPSRLRWQRLLEPLWKRLAGNCHLTRRTGASLVEGGFTIEALERRSMRKALPVVRPTITGVARKD